MKKACRILALCCAALTTPLAHAGEIVGDTFVAKVEDTLHIPLFGGRWQVQAMGGGAAVAAFRLAAPLVGTHPVCDVTAVAGMVASVEHGALAAMIRSGMLDAGMELGPLETRSYGGRPLLRFNTVLNRGGGSAMGDAYVLRGERDYFVVACSANAAAYDAARPLFDELVGNIRF